MENKKISRIIKIGVIVTIALSAGLLHHTYKENVLSVQDSRTSAGTTADSPETTANPDGIDQSTAAGYSGNSSQPAISAGSMAEGTDGIDYDLTKMNADMVYASVYQLMRDPAEFEGKTFKISGIYYAGHDDKNDKYYHYCIIQDAMGCCSQGIEFVWEDGSHKREDYPEDNTEVTIEGTLELYKEDGDDKQYSRLGNSKLKINSAQK